MIAPGSMEGSPQSDPEAVMRRTLDAMVREHGGRPIRPASMTIDETMGAGRAGRPRKGNAA